MELYSLELKVVCNKISVLRLKGGMNNERD